MRQREGRSRLRRAVRFRSRLALLAALAAFVVFGVDAGGPATSPARASVGMTTARGIDGCGWSTASAQAFWSGSPYYNFGLYFGGAQAGCPVDAGFASTLLSQGWHFMPLWVGPQSPCWGGGGAEFSLDPSTAYSQGRSEEATAYNILSHFGWDMYNTPVIYDLEAYNTGSSSCVAAARNFIAGWDAQAGVGTPQMAGVYGSTCGSDLADFAYASTVPHFIDGAAWDGNPNTGALPCVPSGAWVYQQRFKQYTGDHSETWNGYTVTVDNDCSNGPVYPDNAYMTSQGCV